MEVAIGSADDFTQLSKSQKLVKATYRVDGLRVQGLVEDFEYSLIRINRLDKYSNNASFDLWRR